MDKPRDKIKITPAMLKAGMRVLCSFDLEFESREEGVERFFREMSRASKEHSGIVCGHGVGSE